MLSSIGRAAIRRVGIGGQSRGAALLRVSLARCQNQSLLSNSRSYATASKTTAKKPATAASTTKAKAASKPTKATTKEPASRSTKKPTTKSAAKPVKERAIAPKKTAVSKAKPQRKGLTLAQKQTLALKRLAQKEKVALRKQAQKERLIARKQVQKERLAARKQKAALKLSLVKEKEKAKLAIQKEKALADKPKITLRALKAAALDSPVPVRKESVYSLYLQQELKGKPFVAGVGVSEAAKKYKTLSAEERENLRRVTEQNEADNKIAFAKWLENHTPDQILEANKARAKLRQLTGNPNRWRSIEDARLPAGPLTGFNIFTKEQVGVRGGGPVVELFRTAADKWKSMSEAERKPYLDAAEADKNRYLQEYKTVFHRDYVPSHAKAA